MSTKPSSSRDFSHLVPVGAKSGNKAEGDDKEEKDEKAKGAKAEEDNNDEPTEKPSKGKKGKKAEDDKKEKGDDEDDDDKDSKKAAGYQRGYSAGSTAQLDRCAAIFGSTAAAGKPQVAAKFAFNTQMSADDAIAVMETLADASPAKAEAAANPRLSNRMESEVSPLITPNGAGATGAGGADEASMLAAKMVGAYDKKNGKPETK